jgi:hypothetical protein
MNKNQKFRILTAIYQTILRQKNTCSVNENTQLMDGFSAHFGDDLNFA